MGHVATDYAALFALYDLDALPAEPWAQRCVLRGLRDPNPEVRELAIAVAATGDPRIWHPLLQQHTYTEPEPWLVRFCEWVCAPDAC